MNTREIVREVNENQANQNHKNQTSHEFTHTQALAEVWKLRQGVRIVTERRDLATSISSKYGYPGEKNGMWACFIYPGSLQERLEN